MIREHATVVTYTVMRSWDTVMWDKSVKMDKHICRTMAKSTNSTLILCKASAPYSIVASNAAWRRMCGYNEAAIGKSPKLLQGKPFSPRAHTVPARPMVQCTLLTVFHARFGAGNLTNEAKATQFREQLLARGNARVTLANYRANGEPFVHAIAGKKVTSNRGMDYFLVAGEEVQDPAVKQVVLKLTPSSMAAQCVEIAAALLLSLVVVSSLASGAVPFRVNDQRLPWREGLDFGLAHDPPPPRSADFAISLQDVRRQMGAVTAIVAVAVYVGLLPSVLRETPGTVRWSKQQRRRAARALAIATATVLCLLVLAIEIALPTWSFAYLAVGVLVLARAFFAFSTHTHDHTSSGSATSLAASMTAPAATTHPANTRFKHRSPGGTVEVLMTSALALGLAVHYSRHAQSSLIKESSNSGDFFELLLESAMQGQLLT